MTTLDEKIKNTREQARWNDRVGAAYKDGFADGLEHLQPRIAELEAALELSTRYLEHPDVLEITRRMALSGDAVLERNRRLLEKE